MRTPLVLLLVLVCAVAGSEAWSDAVWNIQFSPRPVAAIQFNQDVNVTFSYATDEPGGVRIFARPMAGGNLAPNYAAHGSPLYGPGSGTGTGNFTITSGEVIVDAVRFRVTNADQSVLLMEFYVPVRYHFSPHAIYNIVLTPSTPASMQFDRNVTIAFDYRTTEAGGVRIFARPRSGGILTPNYSAHPSPIHPAGTGNGSGYFTITTGDALVDGIRLEMLTADQSTSLLVFVVPVDYLYRAHSIEALALTPEPPEGLLLNDQVNLAFTYRTTEPGGIRIFPRPFTDGTSTPNYAASGSPLYAVGSGGGTANFTITSGEATVDSIRFHVTNADQSQVLLDYFVPVNYHFASHRISNIRCIPPPPAYFTHDHPDTVLFDYTTTEAGGVIIFARPFTEGSLSPSYAAHPAPTYPAGSGSGDGWFRISAGSVLVDQVRMQMKNANQSQQLVEWFLPVHFQYGTMTATGVDAQEVPLSSALMQNFPNPFNPSTKIRYSVGADAGQSSSIPVRLAVFDLLGREVALLVNEQQPPGVYEVNFDAAQLSSGVYLYRFLAGDVVYTRKMVVLH